MRAEDFIGEGVELNRDREGNLLLKASCDGLCQQQSSGAIRVVDAEEIEGDVTPSKPIESAGLVVVRGDVKQGSSVKAAGDIVICGNLEDATIETGGDLKVNGEINAGENSIIAGGEVSADAISVRRVMAGSLHIKGTVRHCELVTTGDIEVEEVIGGRLEAGGSIRVKVAGDDSRATTELWAGHHKDYLAQQEQQRVVERSVTMKRQAIVAEEQELARETEHVEARLRRLGHGFTKGNVAREIAEERNHLANREATLNARSENLRKEIAQRRNVLSQLDDMGNNASAEIIVEETVHPGVTVKLANADGQKIRVKRDGGQWGGTT